MEYYETVIKTVIDEYKELPGAQAIALIGSRARGTENPLSNVDLMMISSILPDVHQRRDIAQSLADASTNSRCHAAPIPEDNFSCRGLKIRIWHILSDVICDRVAEVDKGRHVTNTLLLSSLAEAKILWDPKNQLRAWKARINPISPEYLSKMIPEIYAEVVSVILDLSKNGRGENVFYFNAELMDALKNICELAFLINGKFFTFSSRISSAMNNLEYLPPDFMERLEKIVKLPGVSGASRAKLKMLCRLTYDLGNKIIEMENYEIHALVSQIEEFE